MEIVGSSVYNVDYLFPSHAVHLQSSLIGKYDTAELFINRTLPLNLSFRLKEYFRRPKRYQVSHAARCVIVEKRGKNLEKQTFSVVS